MSVSAAERIPEELFLHILRYIDEHAHAEGSVSRDGKKQISSCARVCLYWAYFCRPHLFCVITLRSAQDMHEFAAILRHRGGSRRLTRVSRLVEYVVAMPSGTAAPWLHLVNTTVLPFLGPNLLGFNVDASALRTGMTSAQARLTSLHPDLPRTVPASFGPIQRLKLEKVHFDNSAELRRLLRGLPKLELLSLFDLTWTTPPNSEAFIGLVLGEKVWAVETDDSGSKGRVLPVEWFLPALLSSCTLKGLKPTLHSGDYHILLDIFAAFAPRQCTINALTFPGELTCLKFRNES